jgi:hypothetical protein
VVFGLFPAYMATSLSKLALHKDQLALLSSTFYQQFADTLESLLLLNQHNGYKETVFQLSLLLEQLLKDLEDQKGKDFTGSFLTI